MTIETTSSNNQLAQFPVVTAGDLPGLAVLQQWADANDVATRLVAPWVWTDLVPLHHWPNPAGMTLKTWPNPRMSPERETDQEYRRRAEIATASAAGTVLRGMALGLPPNIALEQMHSIHGKIGMMTKLKYSLALSRGVKAWDVKLSEEEVICAGILPATGETIEIGITMDQARKAKWTENEAYQKTPIDMLWARAMSRILDRIAGDVLFGLASVEDLRDLPDDRSQAVTSVTASDIRDRATHAATVHALGRSAAATETCNSAITTTVSEPPAGQSPNEPAEPQNDPPANEEPAETGEAITLAQSRRLYALLRKLDLGSPDDRAAALAVLSFIAERPVESPKHLTVLEATTVNARLDELTRREESKWRAEIRFMAAGGIPEGAEQIAASEGDDRG